ncbi:MAG: hypothetical protein P1U63_09195 [Coxiellaceae bacterium]|nr:hypothetical protein [Coxiellaceae bacterium]
MRRSYLQHDDASSSPVLSAPLVIGSAKAIEEQLDLNARIRDGIATGVARPILLEIPSVGMVEIISLKNKGVTPGVFWRKLEEQEDGSHLLGMIKYSKKGNIKEVVGEQAAMQLAGVALEGQAQIANCFIHPATVGDDTTVVLVSTFNQQMKPMTDFAAAFSEKELNHGVLTVAGEKHAEGLTPASITGSADLLFFSYLCQDSDLIGKACQNKGIVDGQLFVFDLVFQIEGSKFDKGLLHFTFDTLFDLNAEQLLVESHINDALRRRFQGVPLKALDDPYRHIQVRNLSVLQHVPIEQRTAALLRLRRRYPAMHDTLTHQIDRYDALSAECNEESAEKAIYAEIASHYRNGRDQLDQRMAQLIRKFGAIFTVNETIEREFPDEVPEGPVSKPISLDQLIISRLFLLQQLANANRYSYYSNDSRGYVLPAARLIGTDRLSASINPSRASILKDDMGKFIVHFIIEIPERRHNRQVIDHIQKGFGVLGIDAEIGYDSAESSLGMHVIIHENELLKLNDAALRQFMAPETVALTYQRLQSNQVYFSTEDSLRELSSVQQHALTSKQKQFDLCKVLKGANQLLVINYFQMAHALDINELAVDVLQGVLRKRTSPYLNSLVILHKNMRYLMQLPFECRVEKMQKMIESKYLMMHFSSTLLDITPSEFTVSSNDKMLSHVVQDSKSCNATSESHRVTFDDRPRLPRSLNRFAFLRGLQIDAPEDHGVEVAVVTEHKM